jgi:hypothetical protein
VVIAALQDFDFDGHSVLSPKLQPLLLQIKFDPADFLARPADGLCSQGVNSIWNFTKEGIREQA